MAVLADRRWDVAISKDSIRVNALLCNKINISASPTFYYAESWQVPI